MKVEDVIKNFTESMVIFAMRYVRTKEDAEDVWQESSIKIFHKFDEKGCSNHEGELVNFVKAVVRNTAIDHIRKSERCIKTIDTDIAPGEFAAKRVTLPENLHDRKIITDIVSNYKYRGCRKGMLIDYIDGFKGRELGEKYGISTGNVKSAIHYAKKGLREVSLIKDLRA